MNVLSSFQSLFSRPGRFEMAAPKSIPEGTTLRTMRTSDRDACIAIYKENEADNFPEGFLGEFELFLRNPSYLKLVLCLEDSPVAIGGIGWALNWRKSHAWLIFGMVTPHLQRQGLGAALLLARLSAISKPLFPVTISMTNVATSATYYSRYGFLNTGKTQTSQPTFKMPRSSVSLNSENWRQCREGLERLGLTFPIEKVPVMGINPSKIP